MLDRIGDCQAPGGTAGSPARVPARQPPAPLLGSVAQLDEMLMCSVSVASTVQSSTSTSYQVSHYVYMYVLGCNALTHLASDARRVRAPGAWEPVPAGPAGRHLHLARKVQHACLATKLYTHDPTSFHVRCLNHQCRLRTSGR